jgi:hypothetical protein
MSALPLQVGHGDILPVSGLARPLALSPSAPDKSIAVESPNLPAKCAELFFFWRGGERGGMVLGYWVSNMG